MLLNAIKLRKGITELQYQISTWYCEIQHTGLYNL